MEVFLHFSCQNICKFMLSHHQKFPWQNRSKSFTAFLAKQFPRAIHVRGFSILPRFVKILHLSSLCVKFQPTQCIFTINFCHLPSSPNYVRGVSCSSVRVFFSILAHLTHLAHSFFLILNGINKCFDTCLSMQIQEHSIAAHLWGCFLVF